LPIASALTGASQLSGSAAPNGITGTVVHENWGIVANSTDDRARVVGLAQTTSNHSLSFMFQYRVA
jgi:hypothetical protein